MKAIFIAIALFVGLVVLNELLTSTLGTGL